MITDQEQSAEQVIQMVKEGKVRSQQGTDVALRADTICIHGDGAHAVEFAKYITDRLNGEEITVTAMADREDAL